MMLALRTMVTSFMQKVHVRSENAMSPEYQTVCLDKSTEKVEGKVYGKMQQLLRKWYFKRWKISSRTELQKW